MNFLTKWRNQKSRGTTIKHRGQKRVPPWRQASRQLADGSPCKLRSYVLFIINSLLLQIDTNIQVKKKGTLSANNEVWEREVGVRWGGGLVLFDANTNLSHHSSPSHMSPPSDAVFILLPAIGCAPDVLISSPFMSGASSLVPTSLFQLMHVHFICSPAVTACHK